MKNIANCERNAMERIFLFRFPQSFKKIGLISMIALLILLFLLPDEGTTALILKELTKNLLLLSLLMIAMAREDVEDERIASLRAKAFQISFIWAVLYALFQPFANLLVAQFIPVDDPMNFIEISSFQVLFVMLLVQIGMFQLLKKDAA